MFVIRIIAVVVNQRWPVNARVPNTNCHRNQFASLSNSTGRLVKYFFSDLILGSYPENDQFTSGLKMYIAVLPNAQLSGQNQNILKIKNSIEWLYLRSFKAVQYINLYYFFLLNSFGSFVFETKILKLSIHRHKQIFSLSSSLSRQFTSLQK